MCNCNNTTEYRNTCWIKNENFKKCPMVYNSILNRIFDDYTLNKKVKSSGFDSIKEYIINTCNFNSNDWEGLKQFYYKNKALFIKEELLIQNCIPFQYTPEMTNINLRWLY